MELWTPYWIVRFPNPLASGSRGTWLHTDMLCFLWSYSMKKMMLKRKQNWHISFSRSIFSIKINAGEATRASVHCTPQSVYIRFQPPIVSSLFLEICKSHICMTFAFMRICNPWNAHTAYFFVCCKTYTLYSEIYTLHVHRLGKCQIFYTDQYQQTRFYPEKSA